MLESCKEHPQRMLLLSTVGLVGLAEVFDDGRFLVLLNLQAMLQLP